jgi:hypothetical protein
MSAANIFTSAAIMVLSLLESGRRHELRSELFSRCAIFILEIETHLDAQYNCGILTFEGIKSAVIDYNKILSSFSDSHSDYDYQLHKARDMKEDTVEDMNKKRKALRRAQFDVLRNIWQLPFLSGSFIFITISIFFMIKIFS